MSDNTIYEYCQTNYSQLSNKQKLIQNSEDALNNNDNTSSFEELSQITQNFSKVNILEMEPTTQDIKKHILEEDLSIIINNLINLFTQETNKGKEEKERKKFVLDYFNEYKINLQEIYCWLLNNQTSSNSTYLLGYFNYYGIGIEINEQRVCYEYGFATFFNKKKAFELFQKAAELGNIPGIYNLGRCYRSGYGTNVNKKKALELFQEAAKFGSNIAQQNLAWMYEKGQGTEQNLNQAIYWYKKSAEQGDKYSQNKLNKLLLFNNI
ncbi:hypothetical protein RclHR1_10670004 [Rhizophagus clarus]|uniref:Uncharacterized protein n=1 Tax=Rhizophagus clarus TaxID=94130 RepID=A0A2Z6Q6Q5_9GLOM|nr:hypothetical protein RclHR1_10670004 [Rhizophagus clarus]